MAQHLTLQSVDAEPAQNRLFRLWLLAGALVGFLSVALAAVATHALHLDAAGAHLFDTALSLQSWHAAALLGCGVWARQRPGLLVHLGAALLLLGLIAFCAAVYSLAFGTSLGLLAPVGGSTLMLGWLVLAGAALRG
jgi:uncharacterized membrane protein YgdD (TMEM256/DUF423 family)